MSVNAVIRFTQNATVFPAGEAVDTGVAGLLVTCENVGSGNPTKWVWSLLGVPGGSSVPLGVFGLTSVAYFTPDIRGSYQVELVASDVNGVTNRTRKAFMIPEISGNIIPPFTAEPTSMNVGGQEQGWTPYMEAWLRSLESLIAGGGGMGPVVSVLPAVVGASGSLVQIDDAILVAEAFNEDGVDKYLVLYDNGDVIGVPTLIPAGKKEYIIFSGGGYKIVDELTFIVSTVADPITPDGGANFIVSAQYYTPGVTPPVTPPPSVVSSSPTFGPTGSTTLVTAVVANVVAGFTVTVGGVPATSPTIIDGTHVSFVVPAHAAANGQTIVITNPDLQSDSLTNAFSWSDAPAPTFTPPLVPATGTDAGGTNVAFTGTGFQSGCTVLFGSTAGSVTFNSSTSLTVTTPLHLAGAVNITITNPDSQSVTPGSPQFTFTAAPPVINPADDVLTRWHHGDDYDVGLGTWPGRASAAPNTSGGYTATHDIGTAPTAGTVTNGMQTVRLQGGGIKIADLLTDMVDVNAYTIPMILKVDACSTFDTDSFFAREQVISSVSGGGIYCGLSAGDHVVPTPGTANICHDNFNGAFATPASAKATTAVPTASWIFLCLRYDGTNVEIKVGAGAFQTAALAGPLTPGAVAIHLGYGGSAAAISDMTIAEFMVAATVFNNTKVDEYKAYFEDQWNVVL